MATKFVVVQICRSTCCNPSVLNAQTLICSLYLQSIARSAASSCAAVADRTQANLLDVFCTLEDLAYLIGFPILKREGCTLRSHTQKDIQVRRQVISNAKDVLTHVLDEAGYTRDSQLHWDDFIKDFGQSLICCSLKGAKGEIHIRVGA